MQLNFVPEGVWVPYLLAASGTAMQLAASQHATTASPSLSSSRESTQEDRMGSAQAFPEASDSFQSPQISPEASQWRLEVQEQLQAQMQQQEKQVPRSKQIWQRPSGQHAWLPDTPAPMQQQQQQQQESAGSMGGKELMQSLANLVYALTVLMDVAPHQDWMSHFFAASLPHLQAASGAELVQVVRALQMLSSNALEPLPGQQQQQQQQQQKQHQPTYSYKKQKVQHKAGKPQLQQRREARRHLTLHGVPDAWSAVLLQAMQRQASAAAPDKSKELLSELTSRVEAAYRQKKEEKGSQG
uniref:Uncharacterized protein n=1 Tax=Dunaliella tertiolecta TaxID=3047 RepID=A0A7S3QUR1_DUNTE